MLTPIAGSILSVHAHAIGASHGPLVELDMKADHTKMRLRCVEHHGQKCTVIGGPVVVRVCALC